MKLLEFLAFLWGWQIVALFYYYISIVSPQNALADNFLKHFKEQSTRELRVL